MLDDYEKEKLEIRKIGGQPIKNSGRGIRKGDFTWKIFVGDIKLRMKSISVSQGTWAKVCSDTLKTDANSFPLLVAVLGGDQTKTRLAVIEFSLLEELVDCYVKNNK